MTKLKPGDKVVCRVKSGKIVSSYSAYDEEKDFEIIALDFKGYFFYVPDYYGLPGTTIITAANLKSLHIDKRFLNCHMIYSGESTVVRVRAIMDGMVCCSCNEFYPYSEPNQENGKMKCWLCRSYRTY